MKIPFTGQFYEAQSLDASAEKLQNWYIEQNPDGSIVLYPTPGTEEWSRCGTGLPRGSIVANDKLYVVNGDQFFELDTAGAFILKGTISTSIGNVSMAANTYQIIIVDGTAGYIYDYSTDTFSTIADADFPNGCSQVEFMDGYFIVDNNAANLGQFNISALDDGLTWSALDFDNASRSPDRLQAIKVNHRELWLIGETTTEVWYNSGDVNFPFSPIPNGFLEWGCVAPAAVTKADNAIFWLAKDERGQGLIVRSNGFNVQVISTRAIDHKISQLTSLSNAIAYSLQWKGHTFVVFTFPSDLVTLVYDISTGAWFEWNTGTLGRHIGQTYSFFNGLHILGAYNSNKLYKLSETAYTDDGTTIHRLRRSQHIRADDKNVFHHSLWVDMEEWVSTIATPDPQIMLRWSDDGGHTWSNEYWTRIGEVDAFGSRIVWRRLGRSRDRVYEIKITDPVKAVVLGAYARINVNNAREA